MTTARFTLPGALCARLATLHLATDQLMARSPLAHIALSLRGNELRFAATDGKILALLRAEALEQSGDDNLDLILDAAQFTDAAKAQNKLKPKVVTVLIDTDAKEARLGSQHGAGLIALRDGVFPRIDGVLTKHQGGTWWPSLATFDQRYLGLLQKLTGRASPLLRSVAMDGSAVAPIWAALRPYADPNDAARSIPVGAISQLVSAPGWYFDNEMLILVMPISRPEEGGEASFERFMLSTAPARAEQVSSSHAAAA